MCIFDFFRKRKACKLAQELNKQVITPRALIEDQIVKYNESVETYTGTYLRRFYDAWKDSIRKLQVHSIDEIKKPVFEVYDDLCYRPIESWERFLEEVLTRHPDMIYDEVKLNKLPDSTTKYVFNYKNCLDDPIEYESED